MKIGGDSLKITFGHSFSLKIGMITFFGFLCYAISFLIYQKLLIQFDLSSFVPIVTAIVQIIVFLIGIFLLKEKIITKIFTMFIFSFTKRKNKHRKYFWNYFFNCRSFITSI